MTEPTMSKLEIIKELHCIADRLAPSNKYDDIGRVQDILYNLFDAGDIEWLIEQAELTEDIVNENRQIRAEFATEYIDFKKENNRLRAALQEILDIDEHPQFKGLILEHNDYLDQLTMIEEVARQALSK